MIGLGRTGDRARGGERGVTIVEAAFALPILLMFMFGLVDIGMWVFNSNQATNAARDGARLGIIDFETADQPLDPGSMHATIVSAAEARLDRDLDPDQVTVKCVRAGLPLPSCGDARVDSDRIEVTVEWHWDLVTPIAGIVGVDRGAATGTTSMVISGRPLPPPPSGGADSGGTPLPTDCVATISSVTDPVSLKTNSNQLQQIVYVRFTTTGTCTELRVEFVSPNGETAPQVLCGCAPSPKTAPYLEYAYKGSDNIWSVSSSTAPAYVRIYDGATPVGSTTFEVT